MLKQIKEWISRTQMFVGIGLAKSSTNRKRSHNKQHNGNCTNEFCNNNCRLYCDTCYRISNGAKLSGQNFTDAAAKSGNMEVVMGELAAISAANANVKALGIMLVKDHGKANEELKTWAATVSNNLPAAMSVDRQKSYDELKIKREQTLIKHIPN